MSEKGRRIPFPQRGQRGSELVLEPLRAKMAPAERPSSGVG